MRHRSQGDAGTLLLILGVLLLFTLFVVGGIVLPTWKDVPVDPATLGDEAYESACLAVTARLKCPSTAICPPEPTTAFYQEGKWYVLGYVDAQNGFGAMIRSEWAAVLYTRNEGETWTLVTCEID